MASERLKAPGKGCPDRYMACHDHCERYKRYKDELRKEKDYTFNKTAHVLGHSAIGARYPKNGTDIFKKVSNKNHGRYRGEDKKDSHKH